MICGVEEVNLGEEAVLGNADQVSDECAHAPRFCGHVCGEMGDTVQGRVHLRLLGPVVEGDVFVLGVHCQQGCH